MAMTTFQISPWTPENTAEFEVWGHDRHSVLQAGLDAALTLMVGEDAQSARGTGPVVPVRGEGDTTAGLFGDLLDDLLAQIEVHGPVRAAALDGVLKRDRDGFVAWGYLSPGDTGVPLATFERAGEVDAITETPDKIRLRVTLRRLA